MADYGIPHYTAPPHQFPDAPIVITPLERAARVLSQNLKQQADKLGFVSTDTTRYPVLDGCFDMQEAARAVIEAIREPSEAMLDAGKCTRQHWSRMIDALLAEGA